MLSYRNSQMKLGSFFPGTKTKTITKLRIKFFYDYIDFLLLVYWPRCALIMPYYVILCPNLSSIAAGP